MKLPKRLIFPNGGRPPRTILGITLAALFFLFAIWAISSPVGSSNDETRHLRLMWCSNSEDGVCQTPIFVLDVPCFSEKPNLTPACRETYDLISTNASFGKSSRELRMLYYKFGGRVFNSDLESSVLRLRIVNSLIATLMFGATLILGWGRLSRAFLVAFCATLIPLGLFLIPSVNPQSWLFTGTFTSWVLIWLALTETDRRRLIWTLVFTFFAIGLAVASRSDGPLIEAVIVICVSLLAWSEKRLIKQRLLPVAIAGFVLLVWKNSQLLSALKNSLVEQGSGFYAPYYTIHNLPRMIEFYFGDFATRIGDSDTGMPPIVVLGTLFIFVVLLLWAMRSVGRARGAVGVGLLALLVFVPVLVLNNAGYQLGGLFLPRYMWPFLFGFVFVLSSNIRHRSDALSLGEAALVVGAFVPSAIAAQFILVKRYTVSASSTSWDLDTDKLWWRSWGPSPLTTVALGAIFATVFIFGLVTLIVISERNTKSDLA